MQLISNYLDKLETYLPEALQQEVREELEASIYGQIEDKQEQLERDLTPSEQEDILSKIGHPMRVASAYLPNQELIGSDYFPAYKKALEIALAITAAFVFVTAIPYIFSDKSIIGGAITIFANLVNKALYVFALVTIAFYFIQTSNVKLDELYAWSPNDLRVSIKKLSLNRVETGFEIVFYILFLAWWNDFFTWPSQIYNHDTVSSVSLSYEWKELILSINVIIGLTLAISLHKFILAGWSKFSLAVDMALALATFVILYQILQFDQFVVLKSELTDDNNWQTLKNIFDNGIYSVLAVIALVCAWDLYANFKRIISFKAK